MAGQGETRDTRQDVGLIDGLRLAWGMRRAAPAVLTLSPGPRGMGRVSRGRDLAAGAFLFEGFRVDAPDASIWNLPIPARGFQDDIHAFGWLDDLAATGDARAELRARDWADAWIDRFGRGAGPGWRVDLIARRLRAWIDHIELLAPGDAPRDRRLRVSLGVQARHLARRRGRAEAGLARFETLSGLLLAALSIEGMGDQRKPVLKALMAEIEAQILPDGTRADRNPERLAQVFAQLARAHADLTEAEIPVPGGLRAALDRVAPVLRTLRHADGGLARFHGGGRGVPGAVDHALAASGTRPGAARDRAMGFARLSHGRTTLLMDAASPPSGAAARGGHASTLAFELTSGRRPIIVNCGSGRTFGDRWRRAGRATPSHSTLAIDGYSSSRLGGDGGDDPLRDAPKDVRIERRRSDLSTGLIAGHDGYVATHGLTHVRQIYLSHDGRGIQGEDVIATVEREDEQIFDKALDAGRGGIAFRIRFHLHPEVTAKLGGDGQSIELMPKSGELWIFRHTGTAAISVEASVYLDCGALEPWPTKQIVLSSTAVDYATRVSWTLAKARQTPDAVRDIVHEDRPVLA